MNKFLDEFEEIWIDEDFNNDIIKVGDYVRCIDTGNYKTFLKFGYHYRVAYVLNGLSTLISTRGSFPILTNVIWIDGIEYNDIDNGFLIYIDDIGTKMLINKKYGTDKLFEKV